MQKPSWGPRRTTVAAVLAATAVACAATPAGIASTAVPAFPHDIVAFPNRDAVTVSGYEDRGGQTATLEVTRPGVGVVGSADAVVAAGGTVEVNQAGGVCWGGGTGLAVTPDIRPGDTVSVRFGAEQGGDTVVRTSGPSRVRSCRLPRAGTPPAWSSRPPTRSWPPTSSTTPTRAAR